MFGLLCLANDKKKTPGNEKNNDRNPFVSFEANFTAFSVSKNEKERSIVWF
jgi:hypothetical protein